MIIPLSVSDIGKEPVFLLWMPTLYLNVNPAGHSIMLPVEYKYLNYRALYPIDLDSETKV